MNGTNDAPVATFTAAQTATEDSVNAFATDDGAGNYTFALATFIPAADATLSVREFTVTDINGDETAGLTEIPGLTLGSNDTDSSFNIEDNFYSNMADEILLASLLFTKQQVMVLPLPIQLISMSLQLRLMVLLSVVPLSARLLLWSTNGHRC